MIEVITIIGGVASIVTILAFFVDLAHKRQLRIESDKHKKDLIEQKMNITIETETVSFQPSYPEQYLARLVDLFKRIDFKGLGQQVSHRLSMRLDAVYIPTSTVDPTTSPQPMLVASPHTGLLVREERSTMQLSTLLNEHKRLVVLGRAGSGKTTFMAYVSLIIAKSLKANNFELVKQKLMVEWETLPLPIYLPLREFGYYLSRGGLAMQERATVGAKLLLNYLTHYLTQLVGIEFSEDFFVSLVENGQCILMFDGLDEIADFKTRALISDILENLVMQYPLNYFIVSSRPEAYGGAVSLGNDFHICNIEGFSYADVKSFIQKWHHEVMRKRHGGKLDADAERDAEVSASDLLRAINTSEEVRHLANNPLLLTSIAIVHYSRTVLPQRRSELYELCTRILLGEWDIAKVGIAAKTLPWYPGFDDMSTEARRTQLEYVAFYMLTQKVGEASGTELGSVLVRESPRFRALGDPEASLEYASNFLRAVASRGGVLEEKRDERYTFSHQTFQEYLGARRLARINNFIGFVLERLDKSWWREVIRLVIGHLSPSDPERAEALISALLETPEKTDFPHHNLLLAADCLRDADRSALNLQLQHQLIERLQAAMEDVNAPLNARVQAGLSLGWLGDSRNFEAMIEIPAGEFTMGSEKLSSEQPVHTLYLPAYKIGKYPVTNELYTRFIEAKGYQTREYWTDEGWKWVQKEKITQPFYWDDPKFHGPNQPVVGVSWYEAVAYCRWAKRRLPTEAEHEKAAGGPEGFTWPWGNVFQMGMSNSSNAKIGMTSPVGLFSEGSSPYGLLDVAGNVWEWCSSAYAPYPYDKIDGRENEEGESSRVLRGGSWYSSSDECRVTLRRWLHPGACQFNFGFRVAETI